MTWWLVAGALLHFAAHLSPAAPLLGFVAVAPWIVHLHHRRSRRDAWIFFGTMLATWIAAGCHMRTSEIPAVVGPVAGVGAFAVRAPAWLLYLRVRDRLPAWSASLLLAAALVVVDTAQAYLTPLASWGNGGYVVLDDRALLQLVALTGLAGPAFLAHATGSLLGHALAGRPSPRTAAVIASALVLAHLGGIERLAHVAPRLPTTRVATVDTPYDPTPPAVPTPAEREAHVRSLERGLAAAAEAGAELVVFPEAALGMAPADEAGVRARLAAMARAHRVALVTGWAVAPSRVAGAVYENRSAWYDADGGEHLVHAKERPAPGEPIVAGPPLDRAIAAPFGLAAAAICYDATHPDLGRQRGSLGIVLLALPASDWRGIAPTHSEMAVVRGVESGYAVVRATRFGTSLASDAYGRIVARHQDRDPSTSVMIADVPLFRRTTLYERAGEWFTATCCAFVLGALAWTRRPARSDARAPSV